MQREDINSLFFRIKKLEYLHKILHSAKTYEWNNKNNDFAEVRIYEKNTSVEEKVREMMTILMPQKVIGKQKCRIGGYKDSGYVMIEPEENNIVYSLGISNYAPWDLEMAQRGYDVYQFDGTIDTPPDKHEKLHFFKNNIDSSQKPKKNCKNISQIFNELGHTEKNNIIAQIDIEGEEWNFLNHISYEELLKFSQIIIELHFLMDFRQENIDLHLKGLKKLNMTHQSVHIHINNYNKIALFPDYIVGNTMEISFCRRIDNKFTTDLQEYPTPMCYPNNPAKPDIYIGNIYTLLNY